MYPVFKERLRRMSREMGFDPHSHTPFRDPGPRAEGGSTDPPDPPPPYSPDFHNDGNDHRSQEKVASSSSTTLNKWLASPPKLVPLLADSLCSDQSSHYAEVQLAYCLVTD
ncbi:hypothetical protein HPB52_021342 [Rhipicephalus sanguineus]|uniref:Uncharacterized protein n=1 Tax=Rhipicephalus sanguineus TaxID=34632 RepID=A0A9D4SP62_RHISA|nr:hypothetical protein HPB52_021342 [Rhipicephalus sanguineus]